MASFEQIGSGGGILFLPVGTVDPVSWSEADWADRRCSARSGAEIAELDADEVLTTLEVSRRMRARADALEAHALVRLNTLRGGDRFVPKEASLELRISPRAAATRLERAEALLRRMPRLLEVMETGELEGFPAGRITDATAMLEDAQARDVDTALAAKLRTGRLGCTDPTNLVRAARRLVEKIDPGGQAERARHARAARKLELTAGENAMASLRAELPAEVAASAYARIDGMARTMRARGEARTLDQLRADIYADLLLGNDPGTTAPSGAASVFLHMPIDTALMMSDSGCHLAGYGPIPAAIAREIMTQPDSTWRKVLIDPVTGAPTNLGRRRRKPSRFIRDMVAIRDAECSVPGCHRPAQRSDFDHLRGWAEKGNTAILNGAAKCERDHQLKDTPGWDIGYDPSTGTSTVTTPSGRTYTGTRHTVVEPRRSTKDIPPAAKAGSDPPGSDPPGSDPPGDDPPGSDPAGDDPPF